MTDLNKNLTDQLDALPWRQDFPLIVVDADEVLLQFVMGLERYLQAQDLWLDLQSYRLLGNVKERESGDPVSPESLQVILRDFFATESLTLAPVPGAAKALQDLTARATIIVLSNIPHEQRADRAANLASHDMGYPVIANEGLKDNAMGLMAERTNGPLFLLDDITHHLTATKDRLPHCHCIHLIGDPRLHALVPETTPGTVRVADWGDAKTYIETILNEQGF